MVFKFLKKIFAGDGDKSDSEKDGTVAGSSQQKDPHVAKREATILEALSGNFGNHVDAETTLIRNLEKWKHLLQSFADCKFSEFLLLLNTDFSLHPILSKNFHSLLGEPVKRAGI